MVFVPYHRTIVATPLTPDVLAQKLLPFVDTKYKWHLWRRSRKEFRGLVTKDGFRLIRNIKGRNTYLPLINGRFEQTATGTNIIITYTLHPVATTLMAVLFAGIIISEYYVQRGSGLILLLFFFIFHCLMYLIGFLPEKNKAQMLFASLFSNKTSYERRGPRRTRSRLIICLFPLILITIGFLSSCSATKSKEMGELAVKKFHVQYNVGHHADIFLNADGEFRKTSSESDFISFLKAVQEKLGSVQEATLKEYQINAEFGGGILVRLNYDTQFERGKSIEQFIWRIENGQAKLLGYHLNSPVILQNEQNRESEPESASTKSNSAMFPSPMHSRRSLSLPKALLGHWITKENTHYYFSSSKFISVYGGNAHHIDYSVEEVSEEKREMRIKIATSHYRNLTFTEEKNEVFDIAEVSGMKAEEPIKWVYVDNKQKPQ